MKPLTRKEFFMAKAAGQTVPDIEPITREEHFLNQIAESGGGGGGVGGGVVCCEVVMTGDESGYLDMTFSEIVSAAQDGPVFVTSTNVSGKAFMLIEYINTVAPLTVSFMMGTDEIIATAASESDKPSFGDL